jgi:hypothetical protein
MVIRFSESLGRGDLGGGHSYFVDLRAKFHISATAAIWCSYPALGSGA